MVELTAELRCLNIKSEWGRLWIAMVSQDLVFMICEKNWIWPCGHVDLSPHIMAQAGCRGSLPDWECLAACAELLWTHSVYPGKGTLPLPSPRLISAWEPCAYVWPGSTSRAACHSLSSSCLPLHLLSRNTPLALPMTLFMQSTGRDSVWGSYEQPLSSHGINLHLC